MCDAKQILELVFAEEFDARAARQVGNQGFGQVLDLRRGLALKSEQDDLSRRVQDLVRPSGPQGRYERVGEIIDLSEGDRFHAVFQSFTKPGVDACVWLVIVDGKLTHRGHYNKWMATLELLAQLGTDGPGDQGHVYAAKVLGLDPGF